MKINVAEKGGFCFGVRRAVELAKEAASSGGKIYTIGPLIHNKQVISALEEMGIYASTADTIPEGSTAVIRAHGITASELEIIKSKGCSIIDATCPFVEKIHKIVSRESENGREVVIAGKAEHPEVEGIMSKAGVCHVVEDEAAADVLIPKISEKPLSMIFQTTFNTNVKKSIVKKFKSTCKSIQIFDTICNATEERQNEAIRWAGKSDAVVVIGDKLSNNSRTLFDLCLRQCDRTVFVESAKNLDKSLFGSADNIFITAGASTPDFIIKEVVNMMTDEKIIVENNEELMSFEELVEQSFKTLHTGEKVSGIVTQINTNDIHVDLGVKQAGYIPMSELSDDPTYVVADNIKIGDEIEAFVTRVNDVEGLIQLSKKRLDSVKNWEKIENAVETKEILTGVIVEVNKGGVVANVLGSRVFIPASQTGLPKDASLEPMLKTTQQMRITEASKGRRRVVGSIKAISGEKRKEAANRIWAEIEIGKHYTGTVKSFTSYGAFVDIGGVDGMIHISEISWNRIKHPSEALTIGQEVDVFVIGLDAEKKKISLGYRRTEDNPWEKFTSTYNEGDVVNVKVIKFMPFGAFAQVVPGVDGLIHISQISNKRIAKPDDELTIGQEVEAKITHIDFEKQKISLSIRALLNGAPVEEEVETIELQ